MTGASPERRENRRDDEGKLGRIARGLGRVVGLGGDKEPIQRAIDPYNPDTIAGRMNIARREAESRQAQARELPEQQTSKIIEIDGSDSTVQPKGLEAQIPAQRELEVPTNDAVARVQETEDQMRRRRELEALTLTRDLQGLAYDSRPIQYDSEERRRALAQHLSRIGVSPELASVRLLMEVGQATPASEAVREIPKDTKRDNSRGLDAHGIELTRGIEPNGNN